MRRAGVYSRAWPRLPMPCARAMLRSIALLLSRQSVVWPSPFAFLVVLLVQGFVDLRYLSDPPPPVSVLHLQQCIHRPVKVVGDVGYLLVKLIEGVAYDSPGISGSTSKACWHWG